MEKVVKGKFPWEGGEDFYGGCTHDGKSYAPSAYSELAASIVLQAVKDYIKAIRQMWNPKVSKAKKREAMLEKVELEEFFHSEWYVFLCDIDPEKLIYNCHLRAEEQEQQRIRKQNKKRLENLMKDADEGKDGE